MDHFTKPSAFAAIATGAGDSGSETMQMPARVGAHLSAVKSAAAIQIPANCYVSRVIVMPKVTNAAQGTTAPTAGTVDIGIAGTLQKYAAATALNAVSEAAAATAAVTAAPETVLMTTAALDGDVYVALEILPLVSDA